MITLADYQKKRKPDGPMCISFFSPKIVDPAGQDYGLKIRLTINDGDVLRGLESVKSAGGIGSTQDGRYIFIPWPCACVVIHTIDDEIYGLPDDQRLWDEPSA